MLRLDSLKKLQGANPYSHQSVLVGTLAWTSPLSAAFAQNLDRAQWEDCLTLLRAVGVTRVPDRCPETLTGETLTQVLAMTLLSWTGVPDIDFSEWMQSHSGRFVVAGEPEALSRECANLAVIVLSLSLARDISDSSGILRDRLEKLGQQAKKQLLPIRQAAIAAACRKRGISCRQICKKPRIFQLGEGARQYRIELSVSSGTGRLATEVTADKFVSNNLLLSYGLPVSRQILVADADEAWQAARKIGLPVVVKPRVGNAGQGVSVHLTDEEQVRRAEPRAREIYNDVIVESWLPGDDHRILVAGGRIIAATRKLPAQVVGDGESTIRVLIDRENADPRRSTTYRTLRMTIDFDAESQELLEAKGYSLETVPPAGQIVVLKSTANWTTGATTFDVTDRIHPDNAVMVVRAAELIGLDIAGVDFITPDIGQSFRDVGGGICEVNYRPGFLIHMSAEGVGDRDVVGGLIDAIYHPPRQGRIPTLLVCTSGESDELCAGIARELRESWGLSTAYRAGSQLWLGDWRINVGPAATHEVHALAVCDPTVEAVVLAVDPRQVLENGLGVSHADVAVFPDRGKASETDSAISGIEAICRLAGATLLDSRDPETCARVLIETAGLADDGPDGATA
jgi:cyanophycin synthetase